MGNGGSGILIFLHIRVVKIIIIRFSEIGPGTMDIVARQHDGYRGWAGGCRISGTIDIVADG